MLKLKLIKKEPLKLKMTSSFPSIILANLQDKTVTPSEEEQIIIADEGFDGLRQVTVEAMTPPKYAPKFISFQTYSGDNLKYEISNLDTSNIKSMSSMFSNCGKLTELDLSNFDTSNVTDMSNMFYFCRGLTELDLSVFNTNNVTNMSNMFYRCDGLTELDLSNFNTEKVSYNSYMFSYCYRLTKLIINNPSVFRLNNSNAFNSTPIAGYTNYTDGELGYIYVPDDLVETYKTTQVWSTYADQIKGISELPQE